MIQRVVYDVVARGLAAFASNPELYKTVFRDYLYLSDREAQAIQGYFAKNPVRVQHGYPNADIRVPLVSILLQGESMADVALNHNGQTPQGLGQTLGTGSAWDVSLQLMCYTENIDATSYLYEVVKAVLMCSHPKLESAGLMGMTMSGMDLAPDSRYLPENLFVRVLGLRVKSVYILPELFDQTVRPQATVGLHIEAGTSRAPEVYDTGIALFEAEP